MINARLMKKFISKSLTRLDGEWVIIGGTVLSLLGIDERVTMDIDMVALNAQETKSQTLILMEIAESLNLPVEAINQAGEYFLSQIENYQSHLVLYAESDRCKIYRPDAYLFLKLKLARATETDLNDCLAFLKHNEAEVKKLKKQLLKLTQSTLKSIAPEKQGKILKLEEVIKA